MTYADLDVAIHHGKPEKSAEFRRIVAVHEAGHAVLRHALDEGTTEFISIDATPGGVTISSKKSDAVTEDRMARWLIIHLAGRAAEEVIIGSVTSGSGGSANSDLAQATALAVAMETALGFGDRPLLHLDASAQSQLLWAEPKLAGRVYRRLERAYAEGCRLVSEHRERIENLAAALLATGTLDGDTVRTIIAGET